MCRCANLIRCPFVSTVIHLFFNPIDRHIKWGFNNSGIWPLIFPHDGASVLACAYQLKVRSQNPKDFEHWFSQRLWVKFAMFLLNSISVDAGAIIGACYGTSVDACAIYGVDHNTKSAVNFEKF